MERFRIGKRWYTEAEVIALQDRMIDEQFGPELVGPPRRGFARERRERIEAARRESHRYRSRVTIDLATVFLAMMLGVGALGVAPAQAHRIDLVTPNRAGPIVRGETTMGDLRGWFGRPTVRKVIRVGCVRVVSASWGSKLRVYASRGEVRIVEAIFVRARRITSDEHGDLRMHTRRRLRVGDSEDQLRRLYPRSTGETHRGHTHYRLRTGGDGAYLLAKVVDGHVVQLEAWPYEFC